jgi:hypothetical protein
LYIIVQLAAHWHVTSCIACVSWAGAGLRISNHAYIKEVALTPVGCLKSFENDLDFAVRTFIMRASADLFSKSNFPHRGQLAIAVALPRHKATASKNYVVQTLLVQHVTQHIDAVR